jgi:hypothetical protein
LDPTFFGFKPEDRVTLHDNLFELLMRGDGRWDWNTLYNLPVHLRKFWIRKINQKTEKQNEQIEQKNSTIVNNPNKLAKPPF